MGVIQEVLSASDSEIDDKKTHIVCCVSDRVSICGKIRPDDRPLHRPNPGEDLCRTCEVGWVRHKCPINGVCGYGHEEDNLN